MRRGQRVYTGRLLTRLEANLELNPVEDWLPREGLCGSGYYFIATENGKTIVKRREEERVWNDAVFYQGNHRLKAELYVRSLIAFFKGA